MDKKEFLNILGIKPTRKLLDNPKMKQIVNYINNNDNNIFLTNSNYINEDNFLYFITNMKSINNIIEVLNNNSYLFNFNYDYKKIVKFFNIYDPKKINMIAGSMILTDKDYLKYAAIEWTQDIFFKSELVIKLCKNRVEFTKNPHKSEDIEYISTFEQNLRMLADARKVGRLEEVICKATDAMKPSTI